MPAHFTTARNTLMSNWMHSDDIGLLRCHDKDLVCTMEKSAQRMKRSRSMGFFTSSMDTSLHSTSSGESSTSSSVQEREPSVDQHLSFNIINKKNSEIELPQETRSNENSKKDDVSPLPLPIGSTISIAQHTDNDDDEFSCQSSIVSDITENSWILDTLEPLLTFKHVPVPMEVIYISENSSSCDAISIYDDEMSFFDDDDHIDEEKHHGSIFNLIDTVLLILKISVTIVLIQKLQAIVSQFDNEILMKGIQSFVSVAVLYGCFLFSGYRPCTPSRICLDDDNVTNHANR